jgi:micrococcal nuclease
LRPGTEDRFRVNTTAVRCVLALSALLVALAIGAVHAQVSPTTPADVARVVDGDTVDVLFDDGKIERLRLIGIDTPELVDRRKPVECYAPRARVAGWSERINRD